MTIRPKAINGLYNIECAICGCKVKSNMIQIGQETGLPFCLVHVDENYTIPRIDPPEQTVPIPSNEPTDKFITFDIP